jgi:four helix bundle protein
MRVPSYDIDERVFRFACDVIAFVRTITWEPGVNKIVEQLVDAAGSTGANRHESTACAHGREFIRANVIALREARESHFWLRVCQASRIGDPKLCVSLVGEADQIKRILGSIVVNAKANLPKNEGAPKLRTREITKDK